ncbi:MAG TPA: hypothetical protein VF348_00855 [Usitatibacter sp.]
MKEVEKKDVPEVSGGQSSVSPLPCFPSPYPVDFPPIPRGPIDPIGPIGPNGPFVPPDPMSDAIKKGQLTT